MGCFNIISINNSTQKCTVHWEYTGQLLISPEPIFVSPGFLDKEDAANFALSIVYPLAALRGDDIKLPYPVSQSSIDFWRAKIKAIEVFFKKLLPVRIFPVEDYNIIPYSESSDCGLFWGGGIDACSALVTLLDEGKRPTLIRLSRNCNKKDGVFYKLYREISEYYGVKSVIINQNLISYSRRKLTLWKVVSEFIDKDSPFFLLDHPYCSTDPDKRNNVLAYFAWQGFHYFFSSLGVIANNINTIYYASSTHDATECYCVGFNMLDNVKYRGAGLEALVTGDRADQYDILYRQHPEIVKFIKSCNSDKKQWCGKCDKCRSSSIWRHILGFVDLEKVFYNYDYINEIAITEMLSMLTYYRKRKDRDINVEFKILSVINSAFNKLNQIKRKV